ncbi:MAG: NAD(P)-dependent oxidoreductase [Alphaproteobacteria bacterium]
MAKHELDTIGFIGLGQMGGPMSANLARAGFALAVFDAAGTAERAPDGATAAGSVAEVAGAAEAVFLSLPDGAIVAEVVAGIAASPGKTKTVVDLSTIGIEAALAAEAALAKVGVAYLDAPVSGGAKGAVAGTLTIMWAGPEAPARGLAAAFAALAGNVFHVGEKPGQGQAVKLLNNFLSAVAMAATSEAVAFGMARGLEMKTILDVVNVSTGQNTASRDKFPERVLTGSFDAGFATALFAKDLRLYLDSAGRAETPAEIGAVVERLWREADMAMPGSDFTRIYEFISGPGEPVNA